MSNRDALKAAAGYWAIMLGGAWLLWKLSEWAGL